MKAGFIPLRSDRLVQIARRDAAQIAGAHVIVVCHLTEFLQLLRGNAHFNYSVSGVIARMRTVVAVLNRGRRAVRGDDFDFLERIR